MAFLGWAALAIAALATLASLIFLGLGHLLFKRNPSRSDSFAYTGRLTTIVCFLALTVCCGVLVYCFLGDNNTIQYVLDNRSSATGSLAWLYKLSGLWAGRSGSLLFWAWLISLFASIVAIKSMKDLKRLDSGALAVIDFVLLTFLALLLFSSNYMPFLSTSAMYLDYTTGELTAAGTMQGMNTLLEHWAMAIHPPTLFVGYAGLTVPFGYAVAALILNDASDAWVRRSQRFALFSWLFLTIGIALGAMWAYTVLGWGGYWGWDAVENASLLSWLMCIVLVHSMTVYLRHGELKGWSVMGACLAFAFVIVGTFISRSGIVQSVHAFEGDPVSLALFGALIVISILAGAIGLIVRRKTFFPYDDEEDDEEDAAEVTSAQTADAAEATSGVEAATAAAPAAANANADAAAVDSEKTPFFTRSMMYFLSNVIVLVMTVLITYMTISSALPSWLLGGGSSLSAGSYETIVRPIGILYFLMLAVCPLMGWAKQDGKAFLKKARIPALCALALFAVLMVEFFVNLLPAYQAIIAAGGSDALELQAQGPAWYYNGLAILGFAVASLLFFNALFMFARSFKGAIKAKGTISAAAGSLTHFAFAVLLVGLIGSTMYVTTVDFYLDDPSAQETVTTASDEDEVAEATASASDESAQEDASAEATSEEVAEATEAVESGPVDASLVGDYLLECTGSDVETLASGDILYTAYLDVLKGSNKIASIDPSIQLDSGTMQTKQNAVVVHGVLEDYFVVYRGVGVDGGLSIEARVNPLINFVWIGCVLMCVGMALSSFGRRGVRGTSSDGSSSRSLDEANSVELSPTSDAPRAPRIAREISSDGSSSRSLDEANDTPSAK